ncbi:hypothetical protein D9M68_568080 [compost metagenome]
MASEHQAIVNAIVARNAREACRLLADHFQATTDLVLKYQAQQKTKTAAGRKAVVAKELAT